MRVLSYICFHHELNGSTKLVEKFHARSDSFPLVLKEMFLKMPLSTGLLCSCRGLNANQLTGQLSNLGGMNFLPIVSFTGNQLSGTFSNASSYDLINLKELVAV